MALFIGIQGDNTNADIGWRQEKSAAYENGYLIAAEKLFDVFSNFTTLEKDSTIFPIIFLYRQHIELTLKSIIRELDKLNKTTQPRNSLNYHRLLNLWDDMVQSYEAYFKNNSSPFGKPLSNFNQHKSIIEEFNNIDQDSFSFRYSTDKKGLEQLKSIEFISLNNFKTEIDKVINIISLVQDELSHINHH